MNESVKKLFVIAAASILIFWIFKPRDEKGSGAGLFNKKREPIRKPNISESMLEDEDICKAYECLCIYIEAYNAGESESDLLQIKNEFKTQLGIDIYEDCEGRLCVRRYDGEDLLNWN
jgi:hypothetical protein